VASAILLMTRPTMSQISLPSLSLVPTPDELRRGTGALPVQAPGKASASKKSFASRAAPAT